MSSEIIKRDQNFVTVLAGITDDSDQDVTMLRVDPITKRLLVKATGLATGVTSFNGRTGAVTLTSGDVTTALGYTPGTGNGSVTSIIAGSGLAGGTITISGTISLAAAGSFGMTIDGQGGVITTNNYTEAEISGAGTIASFYIHSYDSVTGADVPGSVVVDITRSGVSIIGGGNKPTLSSSASQTANVSGWTSTTLSANDKLMLYVVSATTCTKVYVSIRYTKTT